MINLWVNEVDNMKTNELLQNMIEEHRRLFSDFTIIQNIDVVADTLFETIKK